MGPGRLVLLAVATAVVGCGGDPASRERPAIAQGGWKTDFEQASVPLSEFQDGGPPRDGIPPIDEPRTTSVAEADRVLADREPVIVVELGNDTRAYPLQILVWHEIVNDELAGRPIAVTYCPLCNTALVFDRRAAGRTLTFGTTGKLRRSDLVMWDRQTESWWQQFSGEALVGELTGTILRPVASQVISWKDFRARHSSGTVLSRDTGFDRDYGRSPYPGYETDGTRPFLFDDEPDARLPAKERVVLVRRDDDAIVVPFSVLRRERVVSAEVGGAPVVVFHDRGVASALDTERISDGADVGTAGAFVPRAQGRTLTFRRAGTRITDRETRSTWDVTGRATGGPLRGARLRPVTHDQQFWFAVAAFVPEVRIVRSGR